MTTMYTKSPTTTPRPAKVNLESVHAFKACLSVLRMGSVSSERGKFECVGRRFTYCSMSKLKRENKLKGFCFLGFGKLSQALSQSTDPFSPASYRNNYCESSSCKHNLKYGGSHPRYGTRQTSRAH